MVQRDVHYNIFVIKYHCLTWELTMSCSSLRSILDLFTLFLVQNPWAMGGKMPKNTPFWPLFPENTVFRVFLALSRGAVLRSSCTCTYPTFQNRVRVFGLLFLTVFNRFYAFVKRGVIDNNAVIIPRVCPYLLASILIVEYIIVFYSFMTLLKYSWIKQSKTRRKHVKNSPEIVFSRNLG